MHDRAADEKFLRRALAMARRGMGLASPNPCVGALIIAPGGRTVGTGSYAYDGIKHAEILALEQAGQKARGTTLYINLEPHAHQGRTPPCTDALISAGIRRVVASMPDPNPKVAGRGFGQLRAAGIEVELGGLEAEARRLNEGFARFIRCSVPLVTLKSAMALDGNIAPPGSSKQSSSRKNSSKQRPTSTFAGYWLTGKIARAHVHELRHEQDAILAGIGTILSDNPLLSDRSGRPRRRPLLRVILDSRLRLPIDSRLVRDAVENRKNDVMVFCNSANSPKISEKRNRLEKLGIRVEPISAGDSAGHLDLSTVLRYLAQMEITTLLIEGGSSVNASALSSGLVDKVFLYYAPKILAMTGAVPFATISKDSAPQTTSIKRVELYRFGQDVGIEGYLRDPYAD